jgi:hypothetical protein
VLAGLSLTAVTGALAELAAHGVAERLPAGWRRGLAGLDDVAERLGVPEIMAGSAGRYRRAGEEWRRLVMLVPHQATFARSMMRRSRSS